jgi:hypothetical protein
MTRRVAIDRLRLRFRGVAPATAEAAARLLGGELARALAQRQDAAGSLGALDAGRLETKPGASPETLARDMGARLAQRIGEGRS